MTDTMRPIEIRRFPGFTGLDRPTDDDMTRCIHCGLCLQACPTYRETGMETESPRGRLYLMRAFAEGRLDATSDSLTEHLDLCLQCRACETACPSGVKYGHIIETTTNEIARQRAEKEPEATTPQTLLRTLIFRGLFPNPTAFRAFALATRVYQRTGLQKMVRKSGLLRLPVFGKLADLETMLPPISKPLFAPPLGGVVPPHTPGKPATHRVALFSGCIMSVAFARVNEATVRVLARNGCEIVVPETQTCCGALNIHNGDREYAKEMAKRNIAAFEEAGVEAVIINAAGCGAQLKEYGQLLHNDPEWQGRAEAFSTQVKDISEFLAGLPDLNQNFGRLDMRVTYQDACHLAHAQRIKNPPRQLLKAIPGLNLIEMDGADRCCGSAGIYNVTQYDMSMQILEHKMESVGATHADLVVSGNPGCNIQIGVGAGKYGLNSLRVQQGKKPLAVKHIVEILDEAYRAADGA